MAQEPSQSRKRRAAAPLPPRFRPRWKELTGGPAPARATLPPALISAIGTLHAGAAGAPDVHVFAREVQGAGCDKRAEIAGWYSATLAPGQACIGEAQVKAILDAAAEKVCCETLQCPERCPCHYTPQKKLALYTCDPGVSEEGYLLQGPSVWNCHCIPKDIG